MQTKVFYVGERPGGATRFKILNEQSGLPEALNSFHTARVLMLGSDNEVIVLPAANTEISDPAGGVVTFLWPNESLFTKPGRYVMQVELIGDSATRKTTVQDILIKRFGGAVR